MMTPRRALDAADTLLLDFDGPIAYLMPPPHNAEVARITREAAGVTLPDELMQSTDHIAVIKYLAECDMEAARRAHEAATQAEIECAKQCEPSPWLPWLVNYIDERSLPTAVVTNNSPECARAFLQRYRAGDRWPVEGRIPATLGVLKPSPLLLRSGLAALGTDAEHALFVGDSLSDVEAGRNAGVHVLGFAKSRHRGDALLQLGAVGIIAAHPASASFSGQL